MAAQDTKSKNTTAKKEPRVSKKTGLPYPKPVRTPSKFGPELYRVEDLAAKASIAPSTVWAKIKAGKIKVVRLGGNTRIPELELRRVLEEGF